jgi:hypothetical protein
MTSKPIFLVTYHDRQGKEISREQWSEYLHDPDYKRVSLWTNWCGEIEVSTVWLGMCFGDDRDKLFETMIFRDDNGLEFQDRYPTEEQAIAGHKRQVEWVEAGCIEYDES